jgi:hypothetical protein
MFTLTSTEQGGAIVAVIAGSAFRGGLLADWRRRRQAPELAYHGPDCPGHTTGRPGASCLGLRPEPGPVSTVNYADGAFAEHYEPPADDEGEAEADAFIAELHAEPEAAPAARQGALERGWYARLTAEQEAFMAAHLDDVDAVDDWLARGCPGPGRPAPWLPVSGAWEALELEPA